MLPTAYGRSSGTSLPSALEIPSAASRLACSSTPPGNFGLSRPPDLTTRHQGDGLPCPAASASTDACAEIHANIPVVIGHAVSVPNCAASRDRTSFTVIVLPRGIARIMASTSRGRATTMVCPPQRFASSGESSRIFGRSLSSASFSCQVRRVRMRRCGDVFMRQGMMRRFPPALQGSDAFP